MGEGVGGGRRIGALRSAKHVIGYAFLFHFVSFSAHSLVVERLTATLVRVFIYRSDVVGVGV